MLIPLQAFIIVVSMIGQCSSLGTDHNIIHMSQEIEDEIFKDDYSKTSSPVTFSFAKHFQDCMVLQQAPRRANIYGFSPYIGQKVIAMVTTTTKKYYYTTTVEQGPGPGIGKWFFTLDPIVSADPVSVFVSSDAGTLQLENVLFGDVWLCSGQSNMVFTLAQMVNGAEEIANAHNFPHIRIMNVGRNQAVTPQYDLKSLDINWSLPSNTSVPTFSAVCWLYGKAIHKKQGYPIGLIASDWGGTPDEAWSSPDALAKCGLNYTTETESLQSLIPRVRKSRLPVLDPASQKAIVGGPNLNSILWNSMINPLLGLTLYGVIWYQGEADSGTPSRMNLYNCTFPAMIEDWRLKFHEASKGQTHADFPFGFVQLGPVAEWPPISVGFPDIRWHQTADMGYVPNPRMPNVFMAVAMDLADFNSPYGAVHYRDKEDAAFRLALSGLAIAYNYSEAFQGPFPIQALAASSTELVIKYGSQWRLEIRSAEGFEALCSFSNGNQATWIPTPIVTFNDTSITLYIGDCSNPQALRYAWLVSPCQFKTCAVYGLQNALPAPPFIVHASSDSNNPAVFNFDQ